MIQKLDHDNGTTTCMSPSILFNVLSKCQTRQAQDELKLHSFKRCLLGTGLMSLGDNAIFGGNRGIGGRGLLSPDPSTCRCSGMAIYNLFDFAITQECLWITSV